MKTLYLIRHGRTLFNHLYRMQGISDTPLLPEGERKALELGQAFKQKQISFDAAFSSDLGRARKTAQLILANSSRPSLTLTELEDLREVSFGAFEGNPSAATWEKVREVSGIPGLRSDSPDNIRVKALAAIQKIDPTGLAESYEAVQKRVHRALTQIFSAHGQTIMAVSHGLYINCLLLTLLGAEKTLAILPNTSVTKINYDEEAQHYQVVYIGRESDF
ncbi:histidine phosphatase family protein [Sporolactobacillus spathodeae]|uniref:Phosphoglycerate mutase n=1 Tax=Sporolactobacillus spathodeae TaxID=1465502 RepID=A0ABS2Q6L6_9BACL|nr:histidine phosphatase family protein [Sporolactobacillus spathodeae]MBM7656637.1 putative phosphoglycerate mutase [Sporolactobacillus spathodeae]